MPRVGQKAPLIHTPTPADVGGDLSKITTRIPPDTQNKVDYADVLGKEPIVLLFATPQFCQSRVCGPVVDVAEQLKQLYGDKAAFIHMEIYNDNDPSKDVRPQVAAFHLPSEPWLFAIGKQRQDRGRDRGRLRRRRTDPRREGTDRRMSEKTQPRRGAARLLRRGGAPPLRRDRCRPGDRDHRLRDDADGGPRAQGRRRRRSACAASPSWPA